MTRLALPLILAVLTAACAGAPAPRTVPDPMPAYRAFTGNEVQPVPGQPGTFEVLSFPGSSGPEHYHCAAGRYVTRALGLLPNRRVYLVAPPGPSVTRPGRTALTLTVLPDAALLDAGAALPGDYQLAMTQPGDSFLAASGTHLCQGLTPWLWDVPEF